MSSDEVAAFKREVAEVEKWWKVSIGLDPNKASQMPDSAVAPFSTPASRESPALTPPSKSSPNEERSR